MPVVPTDGLGDAAVIAFGNLAQILRVRRGGRCPEQQLARRDGELAALRWRRFIAVCRRPFSCFRSSDRRSRSGFIQRPCLFPHQPDKADALARQRADQPLLVAIIADRGPRRVDAGRKCKFRHNASAPDGPEDIVLADDAVAIGDEVFQQVEDLRLHGDRGTSATQLAAIRVEHKIFKEIKHFWPAGAGSRRARAR